MYVVGCDKIKIVNIGRIRWIKFDKIVFEFWNVKSYLAMYELPFFFECQKVGLTTVRLTLHNYLFCVWWCFFVCLRGKKINFVLCIPGRDCLIWGIAEFCFFCLTLFLLYYCFTTSAYLSLQTLLYWTKIHRLFVSNTFS